MCFAVMCFAANSFLPSSKESCRFEVEFEGSAGGECIDLKWRWLGDLLFLIGMSAFHIVMEPFGAVIMITDDDAITNARFVVGRFVVCRFVVVVLNCVVSSDNSKFNMSPSC